MLFVHTIRGKVVITLAVRVTLYSIQHKFYLVKVVKKICTNYHCSFKTAKQEKLLTV